MPVLVDSSTWVHQLRRSGDPIKRQRVNAVLEAGQAAWCAPIRLELEIEHDDDHFDALAKLEA